eukprot:TRINITY_DN17230_c0_g1_i1.p1 TRINITY_DN17230_c0_g1~~TRINITY_DN17230_c0_g1_i1.p1  ORF type:complete len:100 (-),score=18.89 TRINITY_DN17230_c0_g1_i1:30-329(-)
MLFYSFFKTLIGHTVVIELKNDLTIEGTLYAVDQFLNLKLRDIKVRDEEKYPHMMCVKNCFIRGSVVRYVHVPASHVATDLLQDASRTEAKHAKESNKQ